MPRAAGDRVVTGRDAHLLVRSLGRPGIDIEDAVESGLIAKAKVEGRWVYHAAEASLEKAKTRLLKEASSVVSSWFLAPMPWLPGIATKRISGMTKDAAEALLHQLVRQQTFEALGLLTKRFQPYLALHLPGDRDAVAAQVVAMEAIVAAEGRVSFRQLPDPPRVTANEGWRATVLQHGEFLGLGTYNSNGWELVGWDRG